MTSVKQNVPMILMDGAAIYDFNENRYLDVQTIPAELSSELQKKLDAMEAGYFIYNLLT